MNETLLSDVENLNDRLELLIQGKAEDIIDELRESNAILRVTLQKYEDDYEEDFEHKESETEELEVPEDLVNFVSSFICEVCNFTSSSQRGLGVHIGVKHKKHSIYS